MLGVQITPGALPHSRAEIFKMQALSSKYAPRLGITPEQINSVSSMMSTVASVGLLGRSGYIDVSVG